MGLYFSALIETVWDTCIFKWWKCISAVKGPAENQLHQNINWRDVQGKPDSLKSFVFHFTAWPKFIVLEILIDHMTFT